MKAIKLLLTAVALTAVALTWAGTASAQMSNWVHEDRDSKMSVQMKGDIEFSDDDSAIKSMSRDAYLRIRGERGRRDWRLDVEMSGGTIEYDYREDGDRIPYRDARDKIAGLLLRVIRESGINADRRVARMLRDGGPSAVFEEVNLIRSSGSSARYLRELVAQADLTTAELRELAKLSVEQIPSSGDRSRLLMLASDVFLANSDAMSSWADAVATLPSSGDKSRTLIKALQGNLSEGAIVDLLTVAESVSSSGDKSRVLLAALAQFENAPAVRTAYFRTARSISSSGDKSRVLIGLARMGDLDQQSLIGLLETAQTISSSGDKSRVLMSVSGRVEGEALEAAFLDVADGISSSGDRSRVLRSLLANS